MTPAEIEAYVGTDFENYYSEFPHAEFGTLVWVNNARVAALCIALGVLGLPVLWLLATNVVSVGVAAALMISYDRGALFFGLILPHGLLELTAVFVAGGVGLRLFWSWIEPGPMGRLESFAREGRTAIAVALGPRRGAARQRIHRGVRDAVGAADVGTHRDRRRGGGTVPRLRLRRRPLRPATAAPPATCSPATAATSPPSPRA